MSYEQAFWYDHDASNRVITFIEKALFHVKGEHAGKPFTLEEFQKREIIEPLFGWKTEDGLRRYRNAFVGIPRKNGKSHLASAIALYMLFADGEFGAEVYSAAADRDQARLVFNLAKSMVQGSPYLSKIAKVYKNEIAFPKMEGIYRVISADAKTKFGFNSSAIILDELMAQKNRELFDALNTSTGARRQPLMLSISTAGFEENSICREIWTYSERILNGSIKDDGFFAYITQATEQDDWTSPETWRKANPGYGVTIKPEYLAAECERAKNNPAYQDTFKRLHLNMWVSSESKWIPNAEWDACGTEKVPDLTGRKCYGGLDLSSVSDLTSFVLVFPPEKDGEPIYVLPHFWIPAENIIERERRDKVPYSAWSRDGFIFATPGNTVDYDEVYNKIVELAAKYKIVDVAFDRWNSAAIVTKLADAGLTMVQLGQGFASMSTPSKELYRLILDRKLSHGGQPVLRWNAENVIVVSDDAGNIKPSKARSKEKIDGIVALIMALDRLNRHDSEKKKSSVYEDRDVLVF